MNETITRTVKKGLQLVGLATVFISSIAFAGEPRSKEELGQIIREYLIKNPEVMIEVQQALDEKQREEMAANQTRTISENKDSIYSSPFQINFGDENAKTTIVEFFDYNCGFCQSALADMQRFLETDSTVRFVLKEFPVLGQPSLEASRVSMAFGRLKPERHGEFHIALLSLEGLKDRDRAIEVAESMGVSESDLLREMEDPKITEAVQEVYRIADGLGITGTPSYIVGKNVVFGAVGYDQLRASLKSQED